mmetsp:Transcript_11130/g.25875  ORF Transcript_11130/g.25875 Transcript_11130/m.25875 type:complete len:82 (-) Transcript_11130:37-282(-)
MNRRQTNKTNPEIERVVEEERRKAYPQGRSNKRGYHALRTGFDSHVSQITGYGQRLVECRSTGACGQKTYVLSDVGNACYW